MCGSLGENQALEPDEKRAVVEAAVGVAAVVCPFSSAWPRQARGRLPVRQDCSHARRRRVHGDAGDGLPRRRREISATSEPSRRPTDQPLMIYNNPVSYFNDVTPRLFAGSPRIDTIVAHEGELGRHAADHRSPERGRRPVRALRPASTTWSLESAVLGIDGWVAGMALPSPTRTSSCGTSRRRASGRGARPLPLVHAAAAPRQHRSSSSTSSWRCRRPG